MNLHWIPILLLAASAGRAEPLVIAGTLSAAYAAVPATASNSAAPRDEKGATSDADDGVAALEKEFADAQQAVFKKLEELASDEEKTKYYLANRPKPADYTARFQRIADENPRTEAAARALAWIVSNDGANPGARSALERLAADHAGSERLVGVCSSLQYQRGEHADTILEKLEKSSPNASVRGAALYVLAKRALEPEQSGSKRKPAEGEALLERVVAEHADVPFQRSKLGDLARGDLFEARELAIGKVAPEIEGNDVDGVRFSLADYRGKVVVLDFWGNW